MPQSFTPFPPRRKPPSNRPLADLVGGCIGPALGKHGFGEADVLMHWPEIVGESLAGRCQPLRLQWRPRKAGGADLAVEPATLVVRVEGGSALVLQHMGPVIIDKVNTYLGWRCVGKIALRQGPLPMEPRRRPKARVPDPQAIAEAREAVSDVEDPALREALARLGAHALRFEPHPTKK
ncbi:DUF721 domain-containing protein [Lichenifustis flavocetrariae]|nr:DciA family protein [Lichenifustis flavocetrariae]